MGCRQMWTNSFSSTAHRPLVDCRVGFLRKAADWLGRGVAGSSSCCSSARVVSGLVLGRLFSCRRERHKYIFQRGRDLADVGVHFIGLQMLEQLSRRQRLVHQHMDGLSEKRGVPHVFELSQIRQSLGGPRNPQLVPPRPRRRDGRQSLQSIGFAENQQLGKEDVPDVGAPFRFIHVMCRDKQGDATSGELEQKIPKGAVEPLGRCRPSAHRETARPAHEAGHMPVQAAVASRRTVSRQVDQRSRSSPVSSSTSLRRRCNRSRSRP